MKAPVEFHTPQARRTSLTPTPVIDASKTLQGQKTVSQVPDAPSSFSTAETRTESTPSTAFGFSKPAVAGVIMAALIGFGSCASAGEQQIGANTLASPDPVRIEVQVEPSPDVARFQDLMGRLEAKRERGEISDLELARARTALYGALVLRNYTALPTDSRGRVDLEALVRAEERDACGERTRGEVVLDGLARDIERRMQVTARDMADPNTRFIDGAPGYKEISEREVRRLVLDALEQIPLGELPGGEGLANLVRGLPNVGHIDAASLNYRELRHELGEAQKDWFDARFGQFFDEHKIEAGVIAFSSITALRYASPEAARLMDGLNPRVTVWRDQTEDGRYSGRARLAWRDQHVLPDVDLTALAHSTSGPTTYRAGVTGTVSLEADRLVTGTATVGARYTQDRWWVDASGTQWLNTNRAEAAIAGGMYDPDTLTATTGRLSGTFGDGVAHGNANGRINLEVDVARDLKIQGAQGSFGFYAGVSADSDGKNDDVRAGVVFRLRW